MRLLLLALLTCLAAAISAAAPSLPDRAFVTAYRATTAPVLDGRLDDACWQHAIEITPFVGTDGTEPAQVQTHAYVCWTADSLYVAVDADEPALRAAVQMAQLVKADQKQRDGNVFSDECIELFVQPTPAACYHLATNTIGTQYDARNQDAAWNGTWQVAVRRGEGRYVMEFRIPFADLGGAPKPGDRWRFNIARERKAEPELSSWSGVQQLFDQPDQFGTIEFQQQGGGARDFRIPSVLADGQTISATVFGGVAMGLLVNGRVAPATVRGATQTVTVHATAGKAPALVVMDGAVCRYRSAGMTLTGESLSATFAAGGKDCTAEMFLNGAAVKGSHLTLSDGLNVVAVRATRTGANAGLNPQVTLRNHVFDIATGWQVATRQPSDGWQKTVSPDGWTVTRKLIWPRDASTVFLRKAFWVPTRKGNLFMHQTTAYLPRGSRNLLQPYVTLPEMSWTAPVRLNIELPAGISYVAADKAVGMPVSGEKVEALPGAERHTLELGDVRGAGFELSLRWGTASNATIAYQPAIQAGGTFDWKHFTATVTAPPDARTVMPLIIKWQNRGISGTFWVDNVVFRAKDSNRNLVNCGTFDEPVWGSTFAATQGEGVNGSRCVKIVAPPGAEGRQQARWVRSHDDDSISVEPGKQYVVELDLKCQNLKAAMEANKVAALFSVSDKVKEGHYPLYTYAETLDGALTEVPAASQLVVLPPLRDVRPKRSRIAPCYYSDVFTSDAVTAAYADNTWRSGMTWTYGSTANGVAQRLLPKGLRVILSTPWEPWSAVGDFQKELEKNTDIQAVDFAGKRIKTTICPTWLLEHWNEFKPYLAKVIDGLLRNSAYAGANWDIEQPTVDPPTFCTCPRCRAAFAKEIGLADPGSLTPDKLLKEYRDQWVAFRCQQNALAMGHLRDLMKAAKPDVEVSLYSGYQSKYTREHYGVDWTKMAPYLDRGIAGYGGNRVVIDDTVAALGKVPFMGGELYYLSPRTEDRGAPNPLTWRNRLFRQYLESDCNGVLIWYLPVMDGGTFYFTSEATAIIAAEEDFLHTAKRDDSAWKVSGVPDSDWFVFRKGTECRVYVMNMSAEAITSQITANDGAMPKVRQTSGVGADAALADGKLAVKIAPYGCAVIHLQMP